MFPRCYTTRAALNASAPFGELLASRLSWLCRGPSRIVRGRLHVLPRHHLDAGQPVSLPRSLLPGRWPRTSLQFKETTSTEQGDTPETQLLEDLRRENLGRETVCMAYASPKELFVGNSLSKMGGPPRKSDP